MRACPRDAFVPEEYRYEALADSPIRLESMEFNVSAPHMHATCIEALDIKPGHRVCLCCLGVSFIGAQQAVVAGGGLHAFSSQCDWFMSTGSSFCGRPTRECADTPLCSGPEQASATSRPGRPRPPHLRSWMSGAGAASWPPAPPSWWAGPAPWWASTSGAKRCA